MFGLLRRHPELRRRTAVRGLYGIDHANIQLLILLCLLPGLGSCQNSRKQSPKPVSQVTVPTDSLTKQQIKDRDERIRLGLYENDIERERAEVIMFETGDSYTFRVGVTDILENGLLVTVLDPSLTVGNQEIFKTLIGTKKKIILTNFPGFARVGTNHKIKAVHVGYGDYIQQSLNSTLKITTTKWRCVEPAWIPVDN